MCCVLQYLVLAQIWHEWWERNTRLFRFRTINCSFFCITGFVKIYYSNYFCIFAVIKQSYPTYPWCLLTPNRSLYHNVSRILVFVLFPNILYFLVGILYVFATWCSPLRLRYKDGQPARQYNKICLGSNDQFGLNEI